MSNLKITSVSFDGENWWEPVDLNEIFIIEPIEVIRGWYGNNLFSDKPILTIEKLIRNKKGEK